MAYFIGFGYSDAFSAHMAELLETLAPEVPVRLTVGADMVCGPCPNNAGGVCSQPERTAGYDRAVLDLCGLEENQILPFGELTALVQEHILAPGRRAGICGDCEWNGICATHSSRWADAGQK